MLNEPKVGQVDHGINIIDSPELIPVARDRQVTFTACEAALYSKNPNFYEDSGFKLNTRRIDEMTEAGLMTNINSSDPGDFVGFFLNDVIRAFYEENKYSRQELIDFQRRAFSGSWMPEEAKTDDQTLLGKYAEDTDV